MGNTYQNYRNMDDVVVVEPCFDIDFEPNNILTSAVINHCNFIKELYILV